MLDNGITRDMFLVSCNPQFNQLRHLVIAGFAELGRKKGLAIDSARGEISSSLTKTKQKAIVGLNELAKNETDIDFTVNILMKFSLSKNPKFSVAAYKAIKTFIILQKEINYSG